MAEVEEGDPPERDVKEFSFRQLRQIRVFPRPEELPSVRANLLAVSNKYGYTVVGCSTGIRVFKTGEIERVHHEEEGSMQNVVDRQLGTYVELKKKILSVVFSCDELTLAVCLEHNGVTAVLFFNVPLLFSHVHEALRAIFGTVLLSSKSDVKLQSFQWNPGNPGIFAVIFSDGSVSLWELSDKSELTRLVSLPPDTNATSICWSPRGKRFVVGLRDGRLVQYVYTPGLEMKGEISCPKIFTEEPHQVVDVLWISAYLFAAVYVPSGDDDDSPKFMLIAAPKNEPVRVTNFDDVYYGMGDNQREQCFFLKHIPQWNMLVSTSCNAYEVVVVAKPDSDKASPWEKWNLEETGRAETPLTSNSDETFPMGMALDFTSCTPVVEGDKQLPPSPILILLSTDGVLCPFHVVNQTKEAAHDLVKPPETLPPAVQRNPVGFQKSSRTAGAPTVAPTAGLRAPGPPSQAPGSAPREAPRGAFSLGPPSQAPGSDPREAPRGTFSLGPPSQAPGSVPREAPRGAFSLGPPSQAPGSVPREAPRGAFSLGPPSQAPGSVPREAPRGAFSLGPPSQAPGSVPREAPRGTFSLGPQGQQVTSSNPYTFPGAALARPQQPGLSSSRPGQTPAPSPLKSQPAAETGGLPAGKPSLGQAPFTHAPPEPSGQTGSAGPAGSPPATRLPAERPSLSVPEQQAQNPLGAAASRMRAATGSGTPTGESPAPIGGPSSGLQNSGRIPHVQTVGASPGLAPASSTPSPFGGSNLMTNKEQPLEPGMRAPSTSTGDLSAATAGLRSASGSESPTGEFPPPVGGARSGLTNQDNLSQLGSPHVQSKSDTPRKSVRESERSHSQNIQEEINHFNEELAKMRQNVKGMQVACRLEDPDEFLKVKRQTEELGGFLREIKTVTKEHKDEIHESKEKLLEAFAMVEEARMRHERKSDPRYVHLLKSRHLDPMTANKMRDLQNVCFYLEKTLREVDMTLDDEWNKENEKKRLLQRPAMDSVYRTLKTHQHVVQEQAAKLEKISEQMKIKRLLSSSWHRSTSTSSQRNGDLSELERSLALNQETILKSPTKQPAAMSKKRLAQLRNMLQKRQTTPVRRSMIAPPELPDDSSRSDSPVEEPALPAETDTAQSFQAAAANTPFPKPSAPRFASTPAFPSKPPSDIDAPKQTVRPDVPKAASEPSASFSAPLPKAPLPQTPESVPQMKGLANAPPAPKNGGGTSAVPGFNFSVTTAQATPATSVTTTSTAPAGNKELSQNVRPAQAAGIAAMNRAASRPGGPAPAPSPKLDPAASIEPVAMVVHKPVVETEATDKGAGASAAKAIADAALKAAQAEASKKPAGKAPPQSSTEFTFRSDGTKPGPPVVAFKPANVVAPEKVTAAPNVTVKPSPLTASPGPRTAAGDAGTADRGPTAQSTVGSMLPQTSGLFSSIGKPPGSGAGFAFAPKDAESSAFASKPEPPSGLFSFAPGLASAGVPAPSSTAAPAFSGFDFTPKTTASSAAPSFGGVNTASTAVPANSPKTTSAAPTNATLGVSSTASPVFTGFSFAPKTADLAAPTSGSIAPTAVGSSAENLKQTPNAADVGASSTAVPFSGFSFAPKPAVPPTCAAGTSVPTASSASVPPPSSFTFAPEPAVPPTCAAGTSVPTASSASVPSLSSFSFAPSASVPPSTTGFAFGLSAAAGSGVVPKGPGPLAGSSALGGGQGGTFGTADSGGTPKGPIKAGSPAVRSLFGAPSKEEGGPGYLGQAGEVPGTKKPQENTELPGPPGHASSPASAPPPAAATPSLPNTATAAATPASTAPQPTVAGSPFGNVTGLFGNQATGATSVAATGSVPAGSVPASSASVPGGGLFGGSVPSSVAPTPVGGLFGSTTSTAPGLFGSTAPASAASSSTTGLFGSTALPASTATSSTTGLFGSTALPTSTATSSTTGLFGSTAPPASTATSSTTGLFGSTAPPASTATSSTTGLFGSTAPPASTATSSTTGLFGSTAPPASTATSSTTGLFGSSPAPASTTTSSAGALFGSTAPTATPTSSTTGLLGSTAPDSTATSSTTGLFGSVSPASTPTSSTGLFGSTAPSTTPSSASFAPGPSTSSATSSLFGSGAPPPAFGGGSAQAFGPTSSSSASAFSSAPLFGGGVSSPTTSAGVFGNPATTSQTGFGQSAFGQPASTSGSGSGLGFGFGGVGLGGQASSNANKNPFGATQGFSGQQSTGSSLFGGKSSTDVFKPSLGGGSFSGGFGSQSSDSFSKGIGGSVASTGFGVPSSQPRAGFGSAGFSGSTGFGSPPAFGGQSGFGAAPAFGSTPAFGSAPAFGATPAFGGSPQSGLGTSPQRVFGSGGAAPGFGQTGASPSFGAVASQGGVPSFGGLAGSPQTQPQQGFGGNTPSQFGGGFGSPQSGSAFSSWR